jgi:hypothetical protein
VRAEDGLEKSEILVSTPEQSKEDVVGDTSASDGQVQQQQQPGEEASIRTSHFPGDPIEDSLFDPRQADPDCDADANRDCWAPPDSTMEQENIVVDGTCSQETEDPDDASCEPHQTVVVDKHWGSNPYILSMRDQLRQTGSGISEKFKPKEEGKSQKQGSKTTSNQRPPIFLMPGLASTSLVAWKYKPCPQSPLLSDIKVQDYVWLNINLIFQMSTMDERCYIECMQLGWNQSDADDAEIGCKLRPDEGLDAISSLSPGGIGSQLLVGNTNTVYAWLIQWLADNLGYDVSNIVGLPYDWRMSPDKMEARDGFLTLTRRRMEAAVQSNGKPGIVVAHSMGNLIFRYFLNWMRTELRREAYERFKKQAARRAKSMQDRGYSHMPEEEGLTGWVQGMVAGFLWQETHGETDEKPDRQAQLPDRQAQLWELAQIEGDANWNEWIEKHIWTYVGLSAPLLGAINPLRAVISGENMGMQLSEAGARTLELSFGSTHTCSPVSSKTGFCDQWDVDSWDEEPDKDDEKLKRLHADSRLACLDDILAEIEVSGDKDTQQDPWENFPALKNLLRKRSDWETDIPMVRIVKESCEADEKSPCSANVTVGIGPKDVQSGNIFTLFKDVWKEEGDPLQVKLEQLKESFWDTKVNNMLNSTWERPLIKHVIMAYGVDIPTEVGYVYRKTEDKDKEDKESYDGIPLLEKAFWETAGGRIDEERFNGEGRSISEILLMKKKPKRVPFMNGHHRHSGDGSVPYLSLSWAHTWLLHSVRALRHSRNNNGAANPLDDINISHRPKGETEWIEGPPPVRLNKIGEDVHDDTKDTGTSHPHGTRYKPEMLRYYNNGTSRTSGIEYTTTVIEAIGVEHKETTR